MAEGWSEIPGEFGTDVIWGVRLRNDGPPRNGANVTAIAKDDSGAILETNSESFSVAADTDIYLGGLFLRRPDVAEITLEISDKGFEPTEPPIGSRIDGTVSVEATGDVGDARLLATIRSHLPGTLSVDTPYNYVLFDADGNIVGGGNDFLNQSVPPGETQILIELGQAPEDAVSGTVWFNPQMIRSFLQ